MYRLLYYLVNVLIRVFYRKLYVNGLENIDKNKTYLITSNHPNGFFEPLIMACTFPIDLYFMVRGDMFEKYWMNKFLRSTHQIPIFRFVDGYTKLKENQSSMMEATATLHKGRSILLFAEGSTEALMRCRAIQKGTAKMAFQAFEDHPGIQLEILPVGINFENWWHPGGESICNIGKPFSANEYLDIESRPKAILELTRRIEQEMKQQIIHVEQQEDESIIRKYWQLLNFKQPVFPRKSTYTPLYQQLKGFANIVNENPSSPTITEVESLYTSIATDSKLGRKLGLHKWWPYLLLPLALPGMLYHAIPVYLGFRFRDQKVKREAFAAPVLGITAFLTTIIMYVLTLVIGSIFIGLWQSILLVIGLALSGFCGVLFWENLHKVDKSKLPSDFFSRLNILTQKTAESYQINHQTI